MDVDWGKRELQDGVEDVYTFFGEAGSDSIVEGAELPTGMITMLTRCYSASCSEGIAYYSRTCPRKVYLKTTILKTLTQAFLGKSNIECTSSSNGCAVVTECRRVVVFDRSSGVVHLIPGRH